MARDDFLVGSRQLVHLLIDGQSPWTGFQLQLNDEYGPSKPHATPVAMTERYPYDAARRGLPLIQSPLKTSMVTVQTISWTRRSLYRHDKHPTLPGYAWVRDYGLQFDIWAATPVLVAALADSMEAIATKGGHTLWSSLGIGLNIDGFQDASYEVDAGIYRAFARGSCTVPVYTI